MENAKATRPVSFQPQHFQMSEVRQPLYAYTPPPVTGSQSGHGQVAEDQHQAPSVMIPTGPSQPQQVYQVPQFHPQYVQGPQPVYVPQQAAPQAYFPVDQSRLAAKARANSDKWGRIVKVSGYILFALGFISFVAGLVRVADGRHLHHAGPWVHLLVSSVLALTGAKGVRLSKRKSVKAAKCYLGSVTLITLILAGGLVAMAVAPPPHPPHHRESENITKTVSDIEAPIDQSENAIAEDISVTETNLAGQVNSEEPHETKEYREHRDYPEEPHETKEYRDHRDYPDEHREHSDHHGQPGDRRDRPEEPDFDDEDYPEGDHPGHHRPPPPQDCALVGAGIIAAIGSFYIYSAFKLLKARRVLKKLSRQPSIMMVAPQYQVSQALPVQSLYPSLVPTGAQA